MPDRYGKRATNLGSPLDDVPRGVHPRDRYRLESSLGQIDRLHCSLPAPFTPLERLGHEGATRRRGGRPIRRRQKAVGNKGQALGVCAVVAWAVRPANEGKAWRCKQMGRGKQHTAPSEDSKHRLDCSRNAVATEEDGSDAGRRGKQKGSGRRRRRGGKRKLMTASLSPTAPWDGGPQDQERLAAGQHARCTTGTCYARAITSRTGEQSRRQDALW
jgi:hypothetical protein